MPGNKKCRSPMYQIRKRQKVDNQNTITHRRISDFSANVNGGLLWVIA